MEAALHQVFFERIASAPGLVEPFGTVAPRSRLFTNMAKENSPMPYMVMKLSLDNAWGLMYNLRLELDFWDHGNRSVRIFQMLGAVKAYLIGWTPIAPAGEFSGCRLYVPDRVSELLDTGATDVWRLPWTITGRVWDTEATNSMIANSV